VVFGRKQQRTQTQLLMDELAESYGHLKSAAGHVAGGTAEKLTPSYDRARNAASRSWYTTRDAFAPLYVQMLEGAANARKEQEVKKNRWPVLVGLLAAGAAVGAAGAMVARRRRSAAQWDEYDPMPAVSDLSYGSQTAESKGSNASQKVTASAASAADSVSSQAGKLADSLHEKSSGRSGPTSDKAGSASDKAARKPSDNADETTS
jgi:hypothetical protein